MVDETTVDNTIKHLMNPVSIQHDVLKEFEERVDDGGMIVDPNNAFMFLLETFSRTTSQAMSAIDNKLFSVYPKRASNIEELFNHVSDYGYVGFFSSPSTTKLSLTLNKQYVIDNAVPWPGGNYSVIIIPKDTTIIIGKYTFSLYYPIVIRVSDVVKNITVVYDTDDENPLHSLNSNTLVKQESNFGGIDLISFEFDVYQFEREIFKETVDDEYGFRKRFTHKNKFYAIRIFSVSNDDVSTEIGYTMSDTVYDPNKATAVIKPITDESLVEVNIPQIYFTNGMIGTKLRVEIYNTLGELDVSIANIDVKDIAAVFAFDSPNTDIQYSSMLKNIPTIIITPTNPRIIGGSDSISFQEMKDIVVYHNYDIRVPITNLDLTTFFKTKGFKPFKKVDNLTDRTYHGFRKVLSSDDIPYGITNLRLGIDPNMIDDSYDTINVSGDGHITVLPTTIYKYIAVTEGADILNAVDRAALLGSEDIVDTLNDELYVNHPYHLVIDTNAKYTNIISYDLLQCNIDNTIFDKENMLLSAQANVISAIIEHLGTGNIPGDGGYKIRIGIQKSAELDDVPEEDFTLYMSFNTVSGLEVGMKGIFLGDFGGLSVYDFELETDYLIVDDFISITNLSTASHVVINQRIPLNGSVKLSTHVKGSYFPDVADEKLVSAHYLEGDYSYIGISLQSMTYSLGRNLSTTIDNNLLINWSGEEYARHEVDVPATYLNDVYEVDENGLVIDVVGEDVNLNKLHSSGDVITDGVSIPEGSDILIDVMYQITARTTLDFTLYGAANNDADTVFICSETATLLAGDTVETVIIKYHKGDIVYSNPADEIQVVLDTTVDDSALDQAEKDALKEALQTAMSNTFIDTYGHKEVVSNRATSYTLEIFGVDFRHSHHSADFLTTLSKILNSFLDTALEIDDSILENTKCFFRPIATIGETLFKINNSLTASVDLSLSFVLKCYVQQSVYVDSALKETIEAEIIKSIEASLNDPVVSFVDICKNIKNKLDSYIVSLDVVSINGQSTLQTMMNIQTAKEPRLDRILIKDSDGTLSFKPDVEVQFESLDTE